MAGSSQRLAHALGSSALAVPGRCFLCLQLNLPISTYISTRFDLHLVGWAPVLQARLNYSRGCFSR